MSDLLNYTLSDGVATLTMNDGKANVMGSPMQDALNAALDRAAADRAVVVLTGRPGMFSGGFDLKVFKSGDPQAMFKMLTGGARLAHRLLLYPHPVLAVASGHAIAMGAFLLQCADVRLGLDQGATVQANEVLIGMTLPHFALAVCRDRVTPSHLHQVGGTGQAYTGVAAVGAGLLDEVAPAEGLMAAAQAQVTRLKTIDAKAFSATKQRLREPVVAAVTRAIDLDIADWSRLVATPA